ncbi:MAG TPA: hypothetical protein VJR47_17135 [Stellaceae bacterium]|nr:hypothetical protein [Stellaceae bacterium]
MGERLTTDVSRVVVWPSLTALLAACVAACHYVPPNMVAQPANVAQSQETGRFKNDIVSVAPVARPNPSVGEVLEALNGAPPVSAPMFQQALVDSLRNASIFADVQRGTDSRYDGFAQPTPRGGARYLLNAKIIKQDEGGYGATVEVQYALIDTATGHSLWSDDLASSYQYPASVHAFFMPRQADTEALWHAFRQNIEAMIMKVAALR